MPIDYQYDPVGRFIRLAGRGDVSMGDRADCLSRLVRDSAMPEGAGVLIDVSEESEASRPTDEELVLATTLIRVLRTRFRGRIAIFNPRNGHATLIHVIAILTEQGSGPGVQAFLDERSAREWLIGSG